jgi:hypothetical protein
LLVDTAVLVAGAVRAAVVEVEAREAAAPTEALGVEARVAVLTEAEAPVHPVQAAAVLPAAAAGIAKDRWWRITENPKATFRSAFEVWFRDVWSGGNLLRIYGNPRFTPI